MRLYEGWVEVVVEVSYFFYYIHSLLAIYYYYPSYTYRFAGVYSPDAYTRLLLDALRGNQAGFVRADELEYAWRIFSPILEQMESLESDVEKPILHKYKYGSRGPAVADDPDRHSIVEVHNVYIPGIVVEGCGSSGGCAMVDV